MFSGPKHDSSWRFNSFAEESFSFFKIEKRLQTRRNDGKKAGGDGKIEDMGRRLHCLIRLFQSFIGRPVGKIHPVILQMPGKVCKGLLRIGEAGESADPVPGQGGIGGGIVITAADQKDFAAGGQLPGPAHGIQSRKQLAKGQIAGTAEDGNAGVILHGRPSIRDGIYLFCQCAQRYVHRRSRAAPESNLLRTPSRGSCLNTKLR